MDRETQPNRIVVVGASAGGPTALQTLVGGLEPSIPAALLVVQHLSPRSPGLLAQMLDRAGPLPVVTASDGAPLVAGQILLAPPDRHLLLQANGQKPAGTGTGSRVRIARGPRENRARPSIDVLFRSSAACCHSRVVGVLLTGMLDDGVVGLQAIQRCGGITIVQEPDDAAYPQMVESALAAIQVDYRLPLAEIAGVLNRLAREPVAAPAPVPEDLRLEVAVNLDADSTLDEMAHIGPPSFFSCPECGGRLWQTTDGPPSNYLCEVGHSYNAPSLLEGMDRAVERSLWVALRTLEERVRMLERMAAEATTQGHRQSAADYAARADETRRDSENVRRFLLEK